MYKETLFEKKIYRLRIFTLKLHRSEVFRTITLLDVSRPCLTYSSKDVMSDFPCRCETIYLSVETYRFFRCDIISHDISMRYNIKVPYLGSSCHETEYFTKAKNRSFCS